MSEFEGWDLSWRREVPQQLIVIRWRDWSIEISEELAKEIVAAEAWFVSKDIAQGFLNA